MRILHVNIGYPPFIGGAQCFLQEVARRAVRRGHTVTACVSDAQEVEHLWSRGKQHLELGVETDAGVTVLRFPVRHLPLLPYSYQALRRLVVELSQLPWASQALLWRCARFTPWLPDLERFLVEHAGEYDLVHAWNIPFESLLYPAYQAAHAWGVPFVFTPLVHLGEAESDHVRRFYTMRHQLALLRESDAVMALTPIERDYLLEQGVPAERLHIIGGGVDEVRLQRGQAERFRARYGVSRPVVLYVGASNYQKGAVHLVQAMADLWRQGYEADLVMVGQAMEHFTTFYQRLLPEEQARCHLLGMIGEQDKADALAACEMLVLPSRTESFGLVYLEAWALGKPVIGARAGAVPAVIQENVNGLLVPFGDVPALAAAIAALLDDPARSRALGLAGQRLVREQHSWEQVEAQLEAVYRSVRGGGKDV